MRRDTSEEGLAKLRPAFHAKGTITAATKDSATSIFRPRTAP